MLVGVAAVGLVVTASGSASPRLHHRRWPTAHQVLRARARRGFRGRSLHHSLLRRARASIVGGSQIAITQASWQVLVLGFVPLSETEFLLLLCGGSIVDETLVERVSRARGKHKA
jgi:hypothetical protein